MERELIIDFAIDTDTLWVVLSENSPRWSMRLRETTKRRVGRGGRGTIVNRIREWLLWHRCSRPSRPMCHRTPEITEVRWLSPQFHLNCLEVTVHTQRPYEVFKVTPISEASYFTCAVTSLSSYLLIVPLVFHRALAPSVLDTSQFVYPCTS